MTITQTTKWKKEDGTEVEIVPWKDIVVTAPGYSTFGYHNDWRVAANNDANQSTQLYRAAMEQMPKETDTWECVHIHQSPDGGNATYRAYIEKAKIPQFRESIKHGMVLRTAEDYLISQGYKIEFRSDFKDPAEVKRLLSIPSHFVTQRGSYEGIRQDAYFYCPKTRDSLEVGFNTRTEGVARVIDIERNNLDSLFWETRREEGLFAQIREEILKEIIEKQVQSLLS